MPLKSVHFQAYGQIVGGAPDYVFICLTVKKDDFNECTFPSQFTINGTILPPTVFTGAYPQIKFNPYTIVDRSDLTGCGIGGIITNENVFTREEQVSDDPLSISIL
jgi:hypothetical protein